jgi:hypothetical protein
MSEFAEQPEDSETRSLFAKPGMSKGEQLAPVALPSGMGRPFPSPLPRIDTVARYSWSPEMGSISTIIRVKTKLFT